MRGPSIGLLAGAGLLALLPSAALAQGAAPGLPEGAGKQLVEGLCVGCHQLNQITRGSGYTREGWHAVTATMIDLAGSPDEQARLLDYLATRFPPHSDRAPTLIAGDVRLTFEEWVTPTLGQRTRDPVEAPDGSIWWAGQFANLIGRLDPATGAMQEYALPAGALPHTVTPDAAGGIWYTGNKNGTMGRLDPRTGAITVYPMPDPAAKDPHTAELDRDGIVWFTLQQSNMVGRLDPATGAVRLVTLPTPDSRPYGIKVAADGQLWIACNGAPCLVRMDPTTMALTEVRLPTPGTTARRLDVAADGAIWYVNSSRGKLGRHDPRTGLTREWDSPSGPDSHPYAIAVVDGVVWYNESGMRPDALVRFDPASETFQSWPIPSGDVFAGIIRHMRPDRAGNLLIHQSSTNRILRVTVQKASAS